MATNVVTPNADPSLSDLKAMIAASATDAPVVETKPEPVSAPAVEAAAAETKPEAAAPAEVKQEPAEEPLPEGVQKRIAKEAEKAARIQSEIDHAVSNRKAKEQELAKLTAESGTAPVKNAESAAATGKPVKPTFGADGQTWEQYQQALDKYDVDHEAYLLKETRRAVEQEFTQRQQQAAAKERWDEAIKIHGAEFPALMAKAQEIAPEGLQLAISGLENWSGVGVHLAKNPARLTELAAKFNASPYAAIAELGRIEAALKTPKTAAPVLPAPPAKDGGGASASSGEFDYENASMSALRAHTKKVRGR